MYVGVILMIRPPPPPPQNISPTKQAGLELSFNAKGMGEDEPSQMFVIVDHSFGLVERRVARRECVLHGWA